MTNIIPFNPGADDACETCPCSAECALMPDPATATDADMDAWRLRCDEAAARKDGARHCGGVRFE